MKKYLSVVVFIVMVTGIIFGCKKSNSPKDYAAAVKDKTWWGTLTYPGKSAEYYSVHFNGDNSLTWSQIAGDYAGQWVLNGKQLTITFTGISVEIKADISDDDKLMNITDNTANSEINSGQLIVNPNISLDNTKWVGVFSTMSYQVSFLTGMKLNTQTSNIDYGPTAYARSASGAVIRFNTNSVSYVFGVITSDSIMRGTDPSNSQWSVGKQ